MQLASTTRAVLRCAVALAALGGAAACGDTAEEPAATTEPAVADDTVAPTTDPPTTSAAPTSTAPTTDPPTTTAAPTTTAPTTTTPPPVTTSVASTTTASPRVAPVPTATIAHGQLVWAVYLGLWDAPPDEAARAAAAAPAEAIGYEVVGWGDAGCDVGSAEALGVDPDGVHYVSGLYFATEADAQSAAAAIGEAVLAVAEVRTFCLD